MEKEFFAGAKKARTKLTAAQSKSITNMYQSISDDIAKEIATLSNRKDVSSAFRTAYLNDLSKQINKELEHIGKTQQAQIKGSMLTMAEQIVYDNNRFLQKAGLSLKSAYSNVPRDVVEELVSGHLYDGKWTLSKSIWRQTKKAKSDIDLVVAKGIAANKSTFEIAKDLEKYVDPTAKKDWDWFKVYPGSTQKIDYNAQRLARTMISHAYEESFVRTTKDNPFFDCYHWLTSNHDNVCELCRDRATGFHGVVIGGKEMPGCYPKDELPLDHPNGRCTFTVEMSVSMDEVGDRIADWVNGKSDQGMDKYAKSMGITV